MTSVCGRERALHGGSEVKLKRKRTLQVQNSKDFAKAGVDKMREAPDKAEESPKCCTRKVDAFPVRLHGV